MSTKLQDDPRDSSLETSEILPYTWYRESAAGMLEVFYGSNCAKWEDYYLLNRLYEHRWNVLVGSYCCYTQQVRTYDVAVTTFALRHFLDSWLGALSCSL